MMCVCVSMSSLPISFLVLCSLCFFRVVRVELVIQLNLNLNMCLLFECNVTE